MAPSRHSLPRRDPVGLDDLRRRIRAIEGTTARLDGGGAGDTMVAFGVPDIDTALPWNGLPKGALHEVIAGDPGAATGFCAAMCGRIAGPVLWCEGRHTLDAGGVYGPGLARFGLDPDRLVLVSARRDEEILWAMEEGLRCGALGAVVGEAGQVSLTAGRRLQLAAASSGVTAFLLRPRGQASSASAAMTRWRVDSAPADEAADGPGVAATRWRAELFRCRGGDTRTWTMEWRDETSDFAVAAAVRDRPSRPQASRLAG